MSFKKQTLKNEATILQHNSRCKFLTLSDDIILCIFNNLDTISLINVSRVCRKFYNLSCDKTLTISVNLISHPLNLKNLWKVLHRKLSANTMSIHVRGATEKNAVMEKLTIAYLEHLCNKCPNLSSLSLEMFDLREVPFEIFPNNLKRLSLHESMLSMGWFDCLKANPMLDLTYLNLHSCSKISNNDLEALSYLKNVKTLILCNCFRISARGIPTITANMKNLVHVDFSGCPGVNNVVLHYLAKLQLEYIGLRFCHLITTPGLTQLFKYRVGATLNYLDLFSCHELTNEALDIIISNTSCLRTLNIGGCNHLTVEKVEDARKKIESCEIMFQVIENDVSDCKNEINYTTCSRMRRK